MTAECVRTGSCHSPSSRKYSGGECCRLQTSDFALESSYPGIPEDSWPSPD